CRRETPVLHVLCRRGRHYIAPRSNASTRDVHVSAVCSLSRSRVRHTRDLLCMFLCVCSFHRETRCQMPARTECCASRQTQSRAEPNDRILRKDHSVDTHRLCKGTSARSQSLQKD